MTEAMRLKGTENRRRESASWRLLLFWPVYGLAFFALEWLIPREYYRPMYHPVDDLIPFNEWFVNPYVFWYIYMVGSVAYTLFRDSLDQALNFIADETENFADEDRLADAVIHFALLSYAAGLASNRYVSLLRQKMEADGTLPAKKKDKPKAKKENT